MAVTRAWHEWDWEGADTAFRRAILINPNYPDVRAFYSHYLNTMGRSEEARAQIARALALDPFNSLFQGIYAVDLLYERRYDDAVAAAREALRIAPDAAVGLGALAMAYHDKGAYAEAVAAERRIYAVFGDRELEVALSRGYSEGGYQRAMRRAAAVLVARPGTADLMPVSVAQFYVHAGDKERTLEWLERAYQAHDPNLPYLGLPDWDSVRGDPRFQDLLRRMRLPG